MLVIDGHTLAEELLPSLLSRSHALTSPVNGTSPCRRRAIAFGRDRRGRHPDRVLPLNYWRHLVAYFALAGNLAYATDDWDLDRWKTAALVIAIATSYGICMEIGQHFLPHRTHFLLTDAASILWARPASSSGISCGRLSS